MYIVSETLNKCFNDRLKYACFFQKSKIIVFTSFSHFNLLILKFNASNMYRDQLPCERNSCKSLIMILMKLHSCFNHGLKTCICFSQNLEIMFMQYLVSRHFSNYNATKIYMK